MTRTSFFAVFFMCFNFYCRGQQSRVAKEAAPSWVTITSINYNASNLDDDAEDGYVDLDYERQISLADQSLYFKTAIKVLSESGVQNNSEVSIDFDPSYQKLIFHTLKIIRGNKAIDKLQSTKFKIVQQEKDLSNHLYNGSLTAFSFLQDVRKGDVIEYSYSLKGFNPLLNRKFSGFFDLQYSVPIYNLYYKIVAPKTRKLTIKNHRTDVTPLIQQSNSSMVYEWKSGNLHPLRLPDHIPNWYDPYPTVMISEFSSWKEVNDWAKALYPLDVKISPLLQRKITEIDHQHFSIESKTVATLQFVQDEIRYTGVETGENAHKPHHPDQTFNQRFGDCKDKSYLLCVMLRKMGIEANPVLVNTQFGKALSDWVPSPNDFDHVTVTARINNETYWFDPTISYQRGDIRSISFPDYQCGLVVSESTNSLTSIPLKEKGMIKARETFNVMDMEGHASLIVSTQYSGKYADNTRDDFKNNSRSEMLKKYKQYYAAYFENLKEDSLSYSEDDSSGMVTTTEFYTVNGFWEVKNGVNKALMQPYLINEFLKKPETAERNVPYELSLPVNYREEIEVNLPEEWNVEESSDVIETPSSVFKYNYTGLGRRVLLSYEYEHVKGFVAPSEVREYLDAYKKISDHSAFELSFSDKSTYRSRNSSTSSKPIGVFPALYSLLAVAFIVTVILRKNRRNKNY